jgi:hypothetical protein
MIAFVVVSAIAMWLVRFPIDHPRGGPDDPANDDTTKKANGSY